MACWQPLRAAFWSQGLFLHGTCLCMIVLCVDPLKAVFPDPKTVCLEPHVYMSSVVCTWVRHECTCMLHVRPSLTFGCFPMVSGILLSCCTGLHSDSITVWLVASYSCAITAVAPTSRFSGSLICIFDHHDYKAWDVKPILGSHVVGWEENTTSPPYLVLRVSRLNEI